MEKTMRNRKKIISGKTITVLSFILLMMSFTQVFADQDKAANTGPSIQPATVSGIVTDPDGNPIPGANVVIKGTTQGTVTGLNGRFEMTVGGPDDILEISFVGYKTYVVTVGNQTDISVQMELDYLGLEELVVIGYGSQKKINTTGAISLVTEDKLKDVSHSSVSQLIQGKVSGVTITKTSGKPGDGSVIRVRGIGTFGDNNPLIVIDGQIVDYGLEDLDPNDIASVNVLKDAGSAAIYGSRAANGVILITTKRGKLGPGNMQVNIYRSWQKLQTFLTMLNAEEFVMIQNEARTNRNEVYNAGLQVYFPEGPDAWKGKGTDWSDVMFRVAPITSANLAMEGGSERIRYRVSGTYYTQDGIFINTGFDKASTRINLDIQVTDKLKFGNSLSYTYSHAYGGTNEVGNVFIHPPTMPVYEPDGSPGYGKHSGELGYSLKFIQDMANQTNDGNRLVGNMFLEYEILDFLRFRVNGGIDLASNRYKDFVETFNVAGTYANTNSSLTDNRSFGQTWVNDYLLYFDKVFDGSHTVNAMAGFSQQFNFNEAQNSRVTDFISEAENNQVLSGGTNPEEATTSGARSELALRSYFGRVNYAYQDKYLLSLNVRADASSRFAKENRWGYFPSVSAAWVVSNESFFNISALNHFKLRVNWGQLGNQSVGSLYPTIATLSQGSITMGPGGAGDVTLFPMVYQGSLVNKDLKWETSVITNIGFDAGLLDNRLNVTFEYFIKDTKDILRSRVIPMTVGLGAPVVNFAEIRNKGFEIELGWKDRIGGDFRYDMRLNLTKLHNEVLSLSEGQDITFHGMSWDGVYVNKVGETVNSFYGYEFDGIYQNQAELDALTYGPAYIGSIKFKDLNGDGQITPDEDRKVLGDAMADLMLGYQFTARYKHFDFMMFWQGDLGRKQWAPRMLEDNAAHRNWPDIWLGRWTGEGSTNKLPRVMWQGTADSGMSSFKMINASYARMKTISLGYNIDLKKVGTLRAYIAGDNLITIVDKDYVGWDPEQYGLNDGLSQYNAWGDTYPGAAVYTIGFNLTLK